MAELSLAAIRDQADAAYPVDTLEGCADALLLFAAGFLGRQDGIHIADAGMTAVCVDYRRELLHAMAAIYPHDWQFVQGDVYALVDRGELPEADVVSVDCPSGHFQICADLIDKWCALARRSVVLGTGAAVEVFPPYGWSVTGRHRRSSFAGGTFWVVLTRETPQ